MTALFDVVSALLIISGALLAVLGAVGVIRLGDPLKAMHAATKPATLGVVLIGLGAALQLPTYQSISKTLVIVVVQLVTVPVGAHMLGRAMTKSQSSGDE